MGIENGNGNGIGKWKHSIDRDGSDRVESGQCGLECR